MWRQWLGDNMLEELKRRYINLNSREKEEFLKFLDKDPRFREYLIEGFFSGPAPGPQHRGYFSGPAPQGNTTRCPACGK